MTSIRAIWASALLATTVALASAPPASATGTQQTAAVVSETQFDRATEEFTAMIDQLQKDLLDAIDDGSVSPEALGARIDPVLRRYQPRISAYATLAGNYFDTQISATSDQATRDQLLTLKTEMVSTVLDIPRGLRQVVLEAAKP